MPRHLRILGLLLIITVITIKIVFHDLISILWLCNISALLAGISLLLGIPYLAMVGAFWMILGGCSWFLNVLVNHTFDESISYFTHFSYTGIAIFLFFRIPIGQWLWLGCFAWYLFSQFLSRFFTPPSENVNLAFSIWPSWDKLFSSYFLFWCFLTLSCLIFLFVMNKVIFRLQTQRRGNN